jgi:hypothetical protein
MTPTPARRKRQVELEEVAEAEAKDEESSLVESVEEDNDDEDMADVPNELASPSPIAKKDMFLRSGKRKRRRSKETSGLTPPLEATTKKKARTSMPPTNNLLLNEPTPEPQREVVEENDNNNDNDNESVEDSKMPAHRGRDSLLLTDHNALVEAQEPLLSTTSSNVPEDDDGRRLFDRRPPSMSAPSFSAAINTTTSSRSRKKNQQTSQKAKSPKTQKQKKSSKETSLQVHENGNAEQAENPASPPTTSYGIFLRFFFLVLFSSLFFTIWPICVKMADMVIPLQEAALGVVTVGVEQDNVNGTLLSQDPPPLQVAPMILKELESLKLVQDTIEQSSKDIATQKDSLEQFMTNVKRHVDVSKRKMMIRFSRLLEAEKDLVKALKDDDNDDDNDLSLESWMDARDAVDALGGHNKLIDTAAVNLWHIDNPVECGGGGGEPTTVADDDPVVDNKFFQNVESNLLLRATMTGEKIVRSKMAEANIRAWVRDQIDAAINSDQATLAALENLTSPKTQQDAITQRDSVEELIQGRLELELADGTGLFDHASCVNGARVLYGGKRGTSKSLVDSLPLYNRLMQLASLRFYGYGPEAAITPTYPSHALGQCWSFQQMPVKEQLKRRRLQKDDHKHGNFGTLTIRLPKPLLITKVSIEHPPHTITDHRNGAVRSFRIIAYRDELATAKAWSLGSFEYDIGT